MAKVAIRGEQNRIVEWMYSSKKKYADPFNEIDLQVEVLEPDGEKRTISAYWTGAQSWKVRYASGKIGLHALRSLCSDQANEDLHDQPGTIRIEAYKGSNSLFRHGRLRVASGGGHIEHSDGTPFFWLGDTWWMAMTSRLKWPEEIRRLAKDRAAKGFSLVQVVVGFPGDSLPFDERVANEGGFPWEKDLSRVNPAYFDSVDRKIEVIVEHQLVPCIVGSWGFALDFIGRKNYEKHWKYLQARYGAYCVVWCVAGEALMPFYGFGDLADEQLRKYRDIWYLPEKRREYEDAFRVHWSSLIAHLRALDSYRNPITIHPRTEKSSLDELPEGESVDIVMLQTNHHGHFGLQAALRDTAAVLARAAGRPVVNGEPCYEGMGGGGGPDIQRFTLWSSILSGARGYTYGANGLFQFNRAEKPFGKGPCLNWGRTPWDEACSFPGSQQVGIARRFFEKHEWHRFAARADWVQPCADPSQGRHLAPYAAGIPGKVRVIYIPLSTFIGHFDSPQPVTVKGLEQGVAYRAYYFDPANADVFELGRIQPERGGDWALPRIPPVFQDLVLTLEAE